MGNRNEEYLKHAVNTAIMDADVLRDIYYERNQMYGCLIKLLKERGVFELTVTRDDFLATSKFELVMTPAEDQLSVTLQLRPYVQEEEVK